ncbi:spore coat protein CotJB [Anaerocolumna sp. MB42-C2]|uniref:spore coat protein CotJB n=1 Tax=Anaerocolumna sp. MB42-C2 TaxID=3070997 RepID=UPI0027E136CC|nr:spore coat protein CotJB [Anaerocolumna sp. MB42-C2]WMJ90478.1 spore coat protein CotJB [Anaerocolumna sp. MB42-C2]
MTNKSREQLMCIITESSFALDDCKLFLDTHPYDREALDYYQNYRQIRKEAMKEYRDCYGPISAYDVADANYWTWIDDPWPWEGAC